jgi:dipeptidyl aminopeptidase/acylaminoacyl peptidase
VGAAGRLQGPVISPEGKTVAVTRGEPRTGITNLWLHDLARGTASRFTFGIQDNNPVWSPDGNHLAFSSMRDGVGMLYQKAISGVAQDEALDKTHVARPEDWSRDGRYIVEAVNDPKTKFDNIWVLPLFGDRKPFPYLHADFNEHFARLSPNGQWLAYQSDETKRDEVYVQTFPAPGGKLQISTSGGFHPVWSRDGKELFFIAGDGKMMAVAAASDGGKFRAGLPKPLFDAPKTLFSSPRTATPLHYFDVSKDGHFLIPVAGGDFAGVPMTVVINWPALLKKGASAQ